MSQEREIHRYPMLLGHEVELKMLQEAWARARSGSPQFVVLLAESGFGKTRLVQEFYSLLSRTEDGTDFWPDSFAQVDDSMDVNPVFLAGQRWGADEEPPRIPWLWQW